MLKNSQTYFKNLMVPTPQDFKSMFGHFSTLWKKKLKTYFSFSIVSIEANQIFYVYVSYAWISQNLEW